MVLVEVQPPKKIILPIRFSLWQKYRFLVIGLVTPNINVLQTTLIDFLLPGLHYIWSGITNVFIHQHLTNRITIPLFSDSNNERQWV